MSSDERAPAGLSRDADAVVKLACEALAPMSPAQQQGGLERLRLRVERHPKARIRTRWALRTSLAAAAFCSILVAWSVLHRPALSFSVSGAELLDQSYVRSGAGSQATVRFSDGSVVELQGSARLRVAYVGSTGARLVLEEGLVRVDVVHKPGASWQVQSGPFQVLVTGTSFTLAWAGERGRLDLHLERGAVSITGPLSEAPIVLRSGQTLSVRLPEKKVLIEQADEPAAQPPAPAVETAAPAPGDVASPAAGPTPSGAAVAAPRPGWTARVKAGQFQAILDEADQRGLEVTLSERGSEDLAALADAARYLGRTAVARRALVTVRERFAHSMRAVDAAFLLGRLDEAGQPRSAISWYDRYLEEAPAGVYASEALGRKMTAIKRLDGAQQARPVAEQYLKRYPSGAYAALAQAIARGQ
jgi:hypothetical protein